MKQARIWNEENWVASPSLMLPNQIEVAWPVSGKKDVPCKCGGSTTELGSEKEADEMC
jgi:hypothetical protein